MALVLGKVWSKRRTLEIYLNIAEWGDGLFGVEAAARRYFHKHASELDAREAALLTTSLPNPIERDPAHPKPFQRRLAAALEAKAAAPSKWRAASRGRAATANAILGTPYCCSAALTTSSRK